MSFPRYENYKNSGVEWLGEVPGHWTVAPLKTVSTCNDEVLEEATPEDFEIEYVEISDVSSSYGIVATTRTAFGVAPSRARRKVRSGDILVSTVRTYLRAITPVGIPSHSMIASTGFAVIRPRRVVSEFLGYLLRAEFFISEVIARSTGVSYPAINATELMRLYVPLPSKLEQTAIASFLDRETAKIDTLVAEQQRLITLLKEKRPAVISRAITKGLDPSASMKDSGIEWLGEIPSHWKIMRGRHLFQKREPQPDPEDGVVTAFRDGQVTLRENRRTDGFTLAILETGYQQVLEGDLVIHGMDAFAGAIGVSEDTGKCSPEYSVLTPVGKDTDNRYFAKILRLMALRNFIFVICPSVRERAPRFRFETFKDVELPVPPLEEQQEIVEAVNSQNRQITSMIGEAEHMVSLLRERRTSLISAAVTGKIDVRGLVTSQPEMEAAA